jgi:poly-gamma-glutamate capsule biosynthesis protein CapA/YwtB (metallophosphatase superfamily)
MDFIVHRKVGIREAVQTGALLLALLFLSACNHQEKYSITFGGDIILARAGEPITPDWQEIDLSLPRVFSTSYYAAALESPLTDMHLSNSSPAPGEMNLCTNAQELSILTRAGLDILSFVNNHQDDCSMGGAGVTQKLLVNARFPSFEENNGVWVSQIPNSNLTIISIEDVSKRVDEKKVKTIIQEQKRSGDLVVISAHWGNEYQAGPDDHQTELAQEWVDAGADVIWGHHPHVLQRVDWLVSSTDGHNALVMYSLGNLMADQFMLSDVQRSALIRVEITNQKITGVTLLPVAFDWNSKHLNFNLDEEIKVLILRRLSVKPVDSIDIEIFAPVN